MAWAVKQQCGSASSKLVLLMLSNHSNGHTGQCNPSHKRLAEQCEMSVACLKTHIKNLEDKGLLTIKHMSQDGVSLPNQYILGRLNSGGVGQNLAEGGSNFDGGVGQNLATKQEVKTLNETAPDGFDEVYQEYPKKVGKPAALRAWKSAKVKPDEVEAILKDIAERKESLDWLKDGGQFIPHPATYLNQRRWEDSTAGPAPTNHGFYI